MSKKRKPKSEKIQCANFAWRLFQRNGIYYACGRKHGHGKNSLGTANRDEAIRELAKLDQVTASQTIGTLVPPTVGPSPSGIGIGDGWEEYIVSRSGPRHLGCLADSSVRKYRNHKKTITQFCALNQINCWSTISKRTLIRYGSWLETAMNQSPRTVHNDLTMQISVSNWLIDEGVIPTTCKIKWKLKKPPGADQYCYEVGEVRRMLQFTKNDLGLQWLYPVVKILSHTGLRISEAINLLWIDVDLELGTIRVRDERYEKMPATGRRMVKDRDSRVVPIAPELADYFRKQTKKTGYVLRGAKGGQLNYNYTRERFAEKVIAPLSEEFPKLAGQVGFENARLHSFRHFFVSQCFAAGCPESDIRDWTGHSSNKIVDLYRHHRSETAKKNISRVDFGAE